MSPSATARALALDSVSLTVPQGAQVAVVGPNGAGKSTLFKALVGLLPIASGEMLLHGQPRSRVQGADRLRAAAGGGRLALPGDRVRRGGHGPLRPGAVAQAADRRRPRAPCARASSGWTSPTWPIAPSGSCRAASSSGSSWPGRSPRSRTSCCSTSRSPGWTSPRGRPLSTCWPACGPNRSPCSSPPTISIWPPAGSTRWCCSTAGSSTPASPREVFTEEHLQEAFGGQMVVVDGRMIVVDQCCCGGDGEEHGSERGGRR